MSGVELTPGARLFLAQREAQGKFDVTDEQAATLARIFAPVNKERALACAGEGTSPAVEVGSVPRGDFAGGDAA